MDIFDIVIARIGDRPVPADLRARRRAAGVVSIVAMLACAAAACSSGNDDPAPSFRGPNRLPLALTRILDTAGNRHYLAFDDTAKLTRITGNGSGPKGMAQLKYKGAGVLLSDFADALPGETGINLSKETYAVTAGGPANTLTVVVGGQNRAAVTSQLANHGWKAQGGEFAHGVADAETPGYVYPLWRVRLSGADVIGAGPGNSLAEADTPGKTALAANPTMSALARCLGNVVAAEFHDGDGLPGRQIAEMAVGVSQPSSPEAVPHAVVCLAMTSQSAARQRAADTRADLISGNNGTEPFSTRFKNPKVTVTGGDRYVVQWQADTPDDARTVFNALSDHDLPGL